MKFSPRTGLLIFGLLLLSTRDAAAVRLVRCNGRVQYRPCEEKEYSKPRVQVKEQISRERPPTTRDSRLFAEVLTRTFKSEGRDGLWSGDIQGFGRIYLTLVLKENGEVRETRSMGNIPLQGSATTFAFRSAIPKYPNWSWDIAARAENLQ